LNDTSPEMAAQWRELLMQRSGVERVRMGDDMFAMARQIMTASLEAQGYRGVELRKQIFLRTYRNDFTPEALDKICRALFDSRG
jgi:hypothetical protein